MECTLISKTESIELNSSTLNNCYRFYFDIPEVADEEHVVWLDPVIGIVEEAYFGGILERRKLSKAKIDGVEVEF